MKQDSLLLKRFRVEELKRRLDDLDGMRAVLDQKLVEIDELMAREHRRAGQSEIGRLALPNLLRSIEARRDNIQNTRKELESQRSIQEQALAAASEDLQDFEASEQQRLMHTASVQTRSQQLRRDEAMMMRHLRKHAAL